MPMAIGDHIIRADTPGPIEKPKRQASISRIRAVFCNQRYNGGTILCWRAFEAVRTWPLAGP